MQETEFNRSDRVGRLIMRELAQMIQRQLSDPRIGMITISRVDVTSDMKYAKVFVTRLTDVDSGYDHAVDKCLKGLNHAARFLRRNLAGRIALRSIPELRFCYDDMLNRQFQIDKLVAKANKDLSIS